MQRARLVRLARMERMGVVLGKDRDCADTHFGRGAHDANSNLTPVGDQ
jgi:hypothetical protein